MVRKGNFMSTSSTGNLTRFSGFADTYDAYRPTPPAIVMDILTQMAQVQYPTLVVDIGCGTGLSTRLWATHAQKVIGIEPNADMRHHAQQATEDANVAYHEGLATATGLPGACADIVTCCQALHWMEPEPTFAEVARILRPWGVFAAIDCDWPPTIGWEIEKEYQVFMNRVSELEELHGVSQDVQRWAKKDHLSRMIASGQFRFSKEVLVHKVEQGDAVRLLGLARSFGGVASLLKHGLSEDEVGLTELRMAADKGLGDGQKPWYFSYRVRVAVK
jgi:ubiquinone/menaquinone biosynthesis C-methylase UbiE